MVKMIVVIIVLLVQMLPSKIFMKHQMWIMLGTECRQEKGSTEVRIRMLEGDDRYNFINNES